MSRVNEAVASSFRIERVGSSRVHEVDFAGIPFGSVYSDHMFSAEFVNGQWNDGLICPYGPLSVSPTVTAFHYGISVFEGMKAYRSPEGKLLLFRPRENARRLQRSATRLAMPPVPESMFLDALNELIHLDQAWVPPADLGALYIRPILFSVDAAIRVKPAERYQFIIFTAPFGSYFSAPADVLVSESQARAFPGGTGDVKAAGNYAAALLAEQKARESGFNSVLWLDALEHRYVEECGVMNVFFVMRDEVVTPPLTGTILPGVTRDSVITLLRDMGHRVKEEPIAIDQVFRSHQRGELRECFGTGTAATVSPVARIGYKNQTLTLPPVEPGNVGSRVKEKLVAVMTGRQPDLHGWVESVGSAGR